MNKIIIFSSILITCIFGNLGWSIKSQTEDLRNQYSQLEVSNQVLQEKLKKKQNLVKEAPIPMSTAYSDVLNHARLLESYSGTNMSVQLDGTSETEDISSHYEDTEYSGIHGLKLQIIIDKFSKETDMGAVLDDIHLLEKDTDFIASEISKDNNNVIVKGEVYGL